MRQKDVSRSGLGRLWMLWIGFAVAVIPAARAQGGDTNWTWRELTPLLGDAPEGRRYGTAIYDSRGRQVITFGGLGANGHLNDTWAFDAANRAWKKLDTRGTSPEPRLGHNAIYDPVGHQMVVWAGQQGARFFNDTWVLDLTTLQWSDVSPVSRPQARYGSASVYDPVERSLVQFAGFTSEGTRFQDTQSFLIASRSWLDITPSGTKPQVRCLHTAALDPVSRRMILYGGQRFGPLDDLWAFDLASRAWTEIIPSSRPAGRFHAGSFVDRNGRFIVFGGNATIGNVNETWAYDFQSGKWSKLEISNPPSERHGMLSAYLPEEGRFIIFGGIGARLYNDVWELNTDATAGSSTQAHFAQFAAGSDWASTFVLMNPSSTETARGTLAFYDSRGLSLAVPFKTLGTVSSLSFTIPPLGSATFATLGTGSLASGWAKITASSIVSGVIKFYAPELGIAGVGASEPVSGFIVPVLRSRASGMSTGVAIAGLGSAVTLRLTLRETSGKEVLNGQTTLQLDPNGHTAKYVEQLFPNAGTEEFEGTLTVSVEGGQAVATAIQLGARQGEFTTLPVTALR